MPLLNIPIAFAIRIGTMSIYLLMHVGTCDKLRVTAATLL